MSSTRDNTAQSVDKEDREIIIFENGRRHRKSTAEEEETYRPKHMTASSDHREKTRIDRDESELSAWYLTDPESGSDSRQSETQTSNPGASLWYRPRFIPPYQEDRCCICNDPLNDRYGILFRSQSGAEARMDLKCQLNLYTLIKGTDVRDIARAAREVISSLDFVSEEVAGYLNRALSIGSKHYYELKDSGGMRHDLS